MATKLDLVRCTEPARLSFVFQGLARLRMYDELAVLLERALEGIPLEVLKKEDSGQGVAALLKTAATSLRENKIPNEKAHGFLRLVLADSFQPEMEKWAAIAMSDFLWGAGHIEADDTKKWLQRRKIAGEVIPSIVRGCKSADHIFMLLWCLFFVDEAEFKQAAIAVGPELEARYCHGEAEPCTVPLLGLMAWCGFRKPCPQLPTAAATSTFLAEKLDNSRINFAINEPVARTS